MSFFSFFSFPVLSCGYGDIQCHNCFPKTINTYADLQFQGLRRLHLRKLDPTLFLRQLYQLSCARHSKPRSIPCWLILSSVWGWFILIFRWSGECRLLDILTPWNLLADLCFSLVRFVYDRGEKCCSYLTYLLSQDWLVGQVYVIQMTLCQRPPGVEQTIRR